MNAEKGNPSNAVVTGVVAPIGIDAETAERILRAATGQELRKRIDNISAMLLGRPYVEGSLGGGPESPEEFRVSLTQFDCVTYMETVLALALAETVDEFFDALRRIRYDAGEISWARRNHYMVDWTRNNEASGFVKDLTSGPFVLEKTCTLNLIAGLPSKTATFLYFPTQILARVVELLDTGDLMLFVSTRETLDVFHTGLLVERGGRWFLRHATRSAGAVIEQELGEFVSRNEMAGFVLLRPLCRR